MFQNARNFVIDGGNFVVANNGATGLQFLHQKIAHGAAHDSAERFPPPRCHPATRRTIFGEIMGWVNDASRTTHVLWLNGAAGAGKTSLAQTLCECLLRTGQLGGSFFFSRTTHSRNNPIYFFATIAYQLAVALPQVRAKIEDVVAQDPSILDKSMEIQLEKLLLEPLRSSADLPTRPIVIVVDGLDECEGESMQGRILQLVSSALKGGPLKKICFMITSRPEPWIRDEYNAPSLFKITHPVSLEQSFETNNDIRSFLRARFADIHDNPKHRYTMANVPKPWPAEKVLDHLVEKASGQFIYPATILKFVDEPGYRPTDRLDVITSIPVADASKSSPLADLDRLYTQILSSAPDKKNTLDILGTIIAMRDSGRSLYLEWRPQQDALRVAEKLLGLQEDDGYLALRTIHSLVHVCEPAIGSNDEDVAPPQDLQEYFSRDDAVRFHHKSFIDFLLDRSRSARYWIDIDVVNARLAQSCLRIMENLSLSPVSRINYVIWGYALLHWTDHCTSSGPPSNQVIDELKKFNLLGCYIETIEHQLTPQVMNDIKRLAFPAKTVFRQLQEKLLGEGTTSTALGTCPDPSDVRRAREFMVDSGARNDITRRGYALRLQRLISWIKTAPDPPTKFWTQCQIMSNIMSNCDRGSDAVRKSSHPDARFLKDAPAKQSFSLF